MLPSTNPSVLLSLLNTKLRDEYPTLDAYCEDNGVSKEELDAVLCPAGFAYDKQLNQYKPL